MTFEITKKAIAVQLQKGTLDKADMASKLDVFLLNGRITESEYNALMSLLDEQK